MASLLFLLWGFAAGTDNLPVIKRYDFAGKKAEHKTLDKELREASGFLNK
ncbi:hypothetical protein L0337_22595 [candidate division KSB1 bacterium]|nr:hypothetical protein [candidate division KSB1 bacterium]